MKEHISSYMSFDSLKNLHKNIDHSKKSRIYMIIHYMIIHIKFYSVYQKKTLTFEI